MASLRETLSVSDRAKRFGQVGIVLAIVGLAGVPGDLRTWWDWLPAITHRLFLNFQYLGLAALAMGIGLWMYGRHLEARIQQQQRQDPIPKSPIPHPPESDFAALGPYLHELRRRFTDPDHPNELGGTWY